MSYKTDETPIEDCNRCVCKQEGYCAELGEYLCEECLILFFKPEIESEIVGAAIWNDDLSEDEFEDIIEKAVVTTDHDGVFSTVTFEYNYASYVVPVVSLFTDKMRGMA